jgi:large subunit ribosomal protein L20
MSRASNSPQTKARHRKWLKRAKGYRGRRHKVFKLAKEAVLKAGQHAYFDRRKKKAVKRQEWQTDINAAARQHGTTYSRLIHDLRQSKIELNRKVLSELAMDHPETFQTIVEQLEKSKSK